MNLTDLLCLVAEANSNPYGVAYALLVVLVRLHRLHVLDEQHHGDETLGPGGEADEVPRNIQLAEHVPLVVGGVEAAGGVAVEPLGEWQREAASGNGGELERAGQSWKGDF